LTPRDNELAKAPLSGNDVRTRGRQILILIDAPFSSRLSRYTTININADGRGRATMNLRILMLIDAPFLNPD
jgi:hypothetical protein